MEKTREKEKGPYREKLNQPAKLRYLEELTTINHNNPHDLEAQDWIANPDTPPPLTYSDIVNYLVFGLSTDTLEEFRSLKSLKAYQQFCSGWVQYLQIHKAANCESTINLTEVSWFS